MKLQTIAALFVTSTLFASYSHALPANNDVNKTHKVMAEQDKKIKQDAEIIGWLIAVNKNEIVAADIAKQKNVTGDVRNYADLMLTEHTKNLHDTEALSKKINVPAAQTNVVAGMEKQGQEEKVKLMETNAKEFPKTYINAMIDGHKEVLSSLDNYIEEANNSSLKSHLEATRAHVKKHLNMAEKIEKNMK